ncbi:MAG: hypothetical protein NVS4B6_03200 [Mycobacterium sp.]
MTRHNDDRLRQIWDKYAPRYDRDMTFFGRLQFAGVQTMGLQPGHR